MSGRQRATWSAMERLDRLAANRAGLGRHARSAKAAEELDRLAARPPGLGREVLGLEREEERIELRGETRGLQALGPCRAEKPIGVRIRASRRLVGAYLEVGRFEVIERCGNPARAPNRPFRS